VGGQSEGGVVMVSEGGVFSVMAVMGVGGAEFSFPPVRVV